MLITISWEVMVIINNFYALVTKFLMILVRNFLYYVRLSLVVFASAIHKLHIFGISRVRKLSCYNYYIISDRC